MGNSGHEGLASQMFPRLSPHGVICLVCVQPSGNCLLNVIQGGGCAAPRYGHFIARPSYCSTFSFAPLTGAEREINSKEVPNTGHGKYGMGTHPSSPAQATGKKKKKKKKKKKGPEETEVVRSQRPLSNATAARVA